MKGVVEELAAKIDRARRAYYEAEGEVLASDEEYDGWVESLRELDPGHPILREVGAPTASAGIWPKSRHPIPLGSLSKAKGLEAMESWWRAKESGLGG